MANKTLVNWLLDFCDQIEGVEKVIVPDEYAQGLHDGSRITQNGIAKKLRYAAEQEKKRLTKRALDGAKAPQKSFDKVFTEFLEYHLVGGTPRR